MDRRSTRARTRLPYSSHPLYKLRKATLITGVIGVFLDLWVIGILASNAYGILPFLCAIVLLLFSIVFVSHDLITYASSQLSPSLSIPSSVPPTLPTPPLPPPLTSAPEPERVAAPGPEPRDVWKPSKRLVITDFVLALLLQWLFWLTFFGIMNGYRYYHNGVETFEAYANLANFVTSVLHGAAFWKEIVARKRAQWEGGRERDLEGRACAGCGLARGTGEGASSVAIGRDGDGVAEREGIFDRVGKRALFQWATKDSDKAKNDGDGESDTVDAGATSADALLVTPDESTTGVGGPSAHGYGTLDQSVDSVRSVPETVVKKKDKGKKRLVDVE